MATIKYVPVSGYCPESHRSETIRVKIAKFPGIPGYKRVDAECQFKNEHGCTDSKHCPLLDHVHAPTA